MVNNSRIALPLALLFAIGCSAAPANPPTPSTVSQPAATTTTTATKEGAESLSPQDLAVDIALARKTLETIHPGYSRYTERQKLDAMWLGLEQRAKTEITRGDLILELSRIVAAIRCDHTKLELPEQLAKERAATPRYLPFRFVLLDNRMFITRGVANGNLARGDEVLAIDGVSVKQWIADISPLISVDGDAEHVKPLTIADSSELMGSGFDFFAPFLRAHSEQVTLRLQSTDGERTVTAKRLTNTDFQALTPAASTPASFASRLVFDRVGDDGAYLKIGSFINYRDTVDAMKVLGEHFKDLADEKRSKLILDLRANGGGSVDAQVALLRHLINAPTAMATASLTRFNSLDPTIKPHLSTWEKAAMSPEPSWFKPTSDGFFQLLIPGYAPGNQLVPAKHAFRGKLVVLIDSSNSSATTHLLAVLKASKRGTFIGQRTGGAPTGATAGIIYFLTLPNSAIRIRVPAIRIVIANADGLPQRNGIEPDRVVPRTIDGLLSDTDETLELAKKELEL